jgi:hypothetical protein
MRATLPFIPVPVLSFPVSENDVGNAVGRLGILCEFENLLRGIHHFSVARAAPSARSQKTLAIQNFDFLLCSVE